MNWKVAGHVAANFRSSSERQKRMDDPHMAKRGLIALAGSLAQKPGHGGHTWVFLQYLLGFKRLGWEVLFLDELKPEMCIDGLGSVRPLLESVNLGYFLKVMEQFRLMGEFSLNYNHGEAVVGLSRKEVLERVGRSAFLINVMGYLSDPEILARAPRRVFLDIDPGFGQMWRELELCDLFRGHDAFVSIGENIGHADCEIPTCGLEWITTPQPVVLEHWLASTSPAAGSKSGPGAEGAFTSIGAWRGPYGPIAYRGHTYGLRVHEFRKFVSIPRLTGQRFEVALDIHPTETRDLELLGTNNWSLVDPRLIAADPWQYQDYLRRSKAEFMVAKNMYVDTRSGWLSDRSICYLASGKPVLAQDTGLKDLYPTGQGLLTFSNLEEAAAGVDEICSNYPRHARAAREIAVEYFDSDKVLTKLLAALGVAS